MAAKKYLSLEEAAEQLAMPVSQLNKLRESGTLRGFADRGTWKFKADDVAEFGRTREVSSDPDVPLMLDDDDDFAPAGGTHVANVEGGQTLEIRMPGEEDDDAELADAPTLVRGAADDDASDSDVRLAVDSSVGDMRDAASGPIDLSDSDSDVRLVGDESSVLIGGTGSDSDVRLIADDSGVSAGDGGSDSDVALVGGSGVGGSSAAGRSVLDDDQPVGGFEDSQLTLGADSGIALDSPLDSGIALSSGDSDVTLSDEDSGLALAADSGFDLADETDMADESSAIALADESGDTPDVSSAIALMDDADGGEDGSSIILLGDDSGLALAADSSGTNLGDSGVADSGIALDFLNDDEDGGPSKTKSLAAAGAGAAAANLGATEADMSAVDEDAGYAVAADDEEGGADTSVILFEDDDEDDFGEEPAAPAQGGSQFELEEDFDDFDGDAGFGAGSAVSAEILEEEDDLDVFEASDDDFDDEFQSGASHAEFAPVGAVRAPDAEFDPVTVSLLAGATFFLLFVGVLAFDLVRSSWGVNEPTVFSETILDMIGSSVY